MKLSFSIYFDCISNSTLKNKTIDRDNIVIVLLIVGKIYKFIRYLFKTKIIFFQSSNT